MKKEAIFFIIILFLIINLSLVFAAENTTVSKKGYDCLAAKVQGKCSSLAIEEKIFSLLASGQCKDELVSDSLGGECWPKSGCKIKTTAQAIFALKENSANVEKAINWILTKDAPATQLQWFVQIDSTKPVKCKVSYSGKPYDIEIDSEKKINTRAGSCLELSDGDYWLEVSSSCYGQDFEISCNESFVTSLLYKQQESSTIYVSEKIHSSSADVTTTERVESMCFKEGTSCNYEATLWASLVLKKLRQNTTAYIPYLVSMADENSRYLPESFLYILLGESYRNEILLKQKESKWWLESGDKFYDTALALYPFQYEESAEKTNAITWLSEVQGTDGCWQGNIRNTAFLLYSIWPKKAQVIEGQKDCEDEKNFCMSVPNCKTAEGTELEGFAGCFGANICCNRQYLSPTCGEQGGEKCSADEICSGGQSIPGSDLIGNEICCFEGTCQTGAQEATCGRYSGTCRTSCLSDEQQSSYLCIGNDVCCTEKTTAGINYTGIIIFSILIVLVALGIIFRKKLKTLITKKKPGEPSPSQFGQQRPGPFGPGSLPSSSPPGMPQRMMPRRIIPSQQQPVRRPLPPRKQEGEFNEVLRKLKEMGK
ncbi:MAG: hypothetical protein Q7S06_01200 [Nanoarchaeota archaeon]|nr:hypothetical protein [Nanoarchaeota archaeon]